MEDRQRTEPVNGRERRLTGRPAISALKGFLLFPFHDRLQVDFDPAVLVAALGGRVVGFRLGFPATFRGEPGWRRLLRL